MNVSVFGGGQYEQLILTTPGLVSHWCLNETGGQAKDRKYTNHGTQAGAANRAKEPPFPGAASLQPSGAATSGMSVPDDNSLDLANGPMTYEAWYRLTSDPGGFTTLFWKGSSGAIHVTWNGTGATDRWEGWTNVNWILAASTTPALTGWHMLHMQKNADATRRIFVDAIDISGTVASVTAASNATGLEIGRSVAGFGFPGYISEASIYNVILSPSQIMERKNMALGR